MTSSGHTDNLIIATKAIRKEPVPGDQISMDIPIGNLRSLPPEASYNNSSGRATLDLRVTGDTLRATATCDSLERMVEYYEDMYLQAMESLEAKKQQLESFAAQKYDPGGVWSKLSFVAGVIAGYSITIVINKLKT